MTLIHRSIHLVFLACVVSIMLSHLVPRDAVAEVALGNRPPEVQVTA